MTLGERIKDIRYELGLPQQALAMRADIPQSRIAEYETDKISPGIDNLCKIARGLRVGLLDLLPEYDRSIYSYDYSLEHTSLAAVIKQQRHRLGLTQAALADCVGIRQYQIAQYERGTHKPSFKQAVEIARTLNIGIRDLYPCIDISLIGSAADKLDDVTRKRVDDYLDMLVPDYWDNMNLEQRRIYVMLDREQEEGEHLKRYTSGFEIYCTLFFNDLPDRNLYATRFGYSIAAYLDSLPNWERYDGAATIGDMKLFRTVRNYKRIAI